jgi:16S rRNA (cytidine1402-2'-O)-methyltransferase
MRRDAGAKRPLGDERPGGWYNTLDRARLNQRTAHHLMAGCLQIVATPIGNLEDITLRALRVLREADLIAAEDTRRTARLLQHYSITTPTTSLHEHNERQKLPHLLERLQAGARIALVSDAGTPTVSDPGTRLVAAALQAAIRVEPVPGPSAVMAALAASGFPSEPFTFMGFPPARAKDRRTWFTNMALRQETLVIFEAPHRIDRTLTEISSCMGIRPIAICRELTKSHEELVISQITDVLRHNIRSLGEFTLVIGPSPGPASRSASGPSDEQMWSDFCHMTEVDGMSRRQAVRELSRTHSTPSRSVYQALERAKRGRS